jgi:serine/threonine-protein kinase
MSPEQAAGKSADKRSDLWSFGVVLIETLTGRQPFTGETVPHVLASVLKGEPDWASLPPQTPVPIRRLLRRCLEKDRKRRLDSAAAARLEIEEASSAELPTATTMRTRLPWIAIAAVAGGAVTGALAWVLVRPPIPAPRPPSRFVISPGGTLTANQFDRVISISADGRQLLYIVAGAGTGTGGQLTVRALDQLDPRPLPGVTNARSPFSSPDGRWVGYFQGTELRKAPLAGGPTALLCAVTGAPRGAIWADDGTVVFATNDPTSGLLRVGSGGGEPVQLTTPRVSDGEGDHWFPSALPDSRGLLFTIAVPGQPDRSEVAVYDAQTGQYRRILRGSQAQYVQSGHVLYIAAGSLWAVHFDLTTLQVSGDPLPVIEGVRTAVQTGAADYQVSHSGALAYVPAGPPAQRSLAWVDRSGSEETIKAPPRAYVLPRLSPDGTRIALDVRDQENDIWILSLTGDATPRRLTYGPSVETNPVWIDNSRLVYTSSRSGRLALYSQAADGSGTPQQVTESGNGQYATTITRDATAVVGHQDGPTVFDIVLFTIPQPGQAAPPVKELVKTPSFEFNADISPNGRYLAYQSNESGPFQVIVRPFPDVDSGRWTVSPVEGSSPLWSRDGKELFYRDESDRIVAVPVETSGNTFRWGVPRQLFEFRGSTTVPNRSFDVSVDGRRFLVVNDAASTRAADIVLVLDWLEDLKAKVPVK